MFERRINDEDVLQVIQTGETIENYPDDKPYPSRLILGWSKSRLLHVVIADNKEDNKTVVITVYEPDPIDGMQTLGVESNEMRNL